ncbi:MAG: DUF3096 domain-containing protein [Dehalococcoidales bacterium]|nr:DUF3096 domain-containing protein [Dehalococcoidales bacterium]
MLEKILANKMTIPIILVVAGILILAVGAALRWIVGVILIIWGILKFFGKV